MAFLYKNIAQVDTQIACLVTSIVFVYVLVVDKTCHLNVHGCRISSFIDDGKFR